MGCFGSKRAEEFKRDLEQLELKAQKKPWDLRQLDALEDAAEVLRQLNGNPLKDAHKARLDQLGQQLKQELMRLMDMTLVQKGENPAWLTIQNIARVLDRSVPGTSESVQAKYSELLRKIAAEKLSKAKNDISKVRDPTTLLEGCRRALRSLTEAEPHVVKVMALCPEYLSLSKELATKIMENLSGLLELDPQRLQEVVRQAEILDSNARKFADRTKSAWEPVMDRIRVVLVPGKLEQLEGVLAQEYTAADLLAALNELNLVLGSQQSEVGPRLKTAMQTCKQFVTSSFDAALSAGETNDMDVFVSIASVHDSLLDKLSGGSCSESEKIAKDLKTRKAGLTLKELLANAGSNVKQQAKDLSESYREAEQKVKEMKPEKLKEFAEVPKWRFKLGLGGWKDFDGAKSAEVEKLYQDWVKKGRPAAVSERRCQISIMVGPGGRKATTKSAPVRRGRPRCEYGAACYRKNPAHKAEFAHPNDADWDDPLPAESTETPPMSTLVSEPAGGVLGPGTESLRSKEERYSLDFQMMTQLNLTREGKGMRSIQRIEGMTFAQKHTHEYFAKVKLFVQNAENIFSQAEDELGLLETNDARRRMQDQLSALAQAMKPSLIDFLNVAVLIKDMTIIDEIIVMLGAHADGLELKNSLKDVRLQDVLAALAKAYSTPGAPADAEPKRRSAKELWSLVQMGGQRQKIGQWLLRCKPNIHKKAREIQVLVQRHAEMRCQALLQEYEDDDDFGEQFRTKTGKVLEDAVKRAARHGQFEEMQGIIKTALRWNCSMAKFTEAAAGSIATAISGACNADLEYQRLGRVTEVLMADQQLAKAAGVRSKELCALKSFIPTIAQKALKEARDPRLKPRPLKPGEMDTNSVKQTVELHRQLPTEDLKRSFTEAFWELYQPWYNDPANRQVSVEWAVAFCEQLDMKVPPWMMNHDQLEALRRLEEAMEGGDENRVREALILAKQTDYKSHAELKERYDSSIAKLRTMKRLPPGWDVVHLIGETGEEKMFGKVDLTDSVVKMAFQRLFDSTRSHIVTRDRKDPMPKGFVVEKIQEVRNAESWASYCGRKDAIIPACGTHSAAPLAEAVWQSWSGKMETLGIGAEILKAANLPELEPKANEFLMFHGTNPAAADSIAKNHFDMAFACKTGLFGAGLYFAESSSKSDEYVKKSDDDQYPVLICRVVLGRINYIDHKDPATNPGRAKMETSCSSGEYHSVLGDRKKVRGTYREFIVYDHYQVYPHFIVWYKRVY